jgi:hypothetical protein
MHLHQHHGSKTESAVVKCPTEAHHRDNESVANGSKDVKKMMKHHHNNETETAIANGSKDDKKMMHHHHNDRKNGSEKAMNSKRTVQGSRMSFKQRHRHMEKLKLRNAIHVY